MKLNKILNRLEELSVEVNTKDYYVNNEECKIYIGGNDICLVLHFDDINNNIKENNINDIDVDKITIHGNIMKCIYAKPEELFNLEESENIFFNDFTKCKNFISKHKLFPRKVYYSHGNIDCFTFSPSNRNIICKINDITKTKMIMKPVFIEE